MLITFFKEELKFTDEEIIYFTEYEIKCLINLFERKTYEHYPVRMEAKLKAFA